MRTGVLHGISAEGLGLKIIAVGEGGWCYCRAGARRSWGGGGVCWRTVRYECRPLFFIFATNRQVV